MAFPHSVYRASWSVDPFSFPLTGETPNSAWELEPYKAQLSYDVQAVEFIYMYAQSLLP